MVISAAVRPSHSSEGEPAKDGAAPPACNRSLKLSGNVAALGFVSLCMGMSSAMIYGLLPAFPVSRRAGSTRSKASSRRRPRSSRSSPAGSATGSAGANFWSSPATVCPRSQSCCSRWRKAQPQCLLARMLDRVGKGMRDAPRDALLADVTPSEIRGSGVGLRAALYTVGAVAGPLAAVALMLASGDKFSVRVLAGGDSRVRSWSCCSRSRTPRSPPKSRCGHDPPQRSLSPRPDLLAGGIGRGAAGARALQPGLSAAEGRWRRGRSRARADSPGADEFSCFP
jgi:MFS family permease